MKIILYTICLSIFCFAGFAQNEGSDKVPLFVPPKEILDLHGTIVFTKQEKQPTPFEQCGLVTSENGEAMEGVFNMYKIPAFAPLDPNFNVDEFVKLAQSASKSLTPVISEGSASVRYNLQNGPIQKGDYITISSEPGVGMKATASGFTVGVALENSDATEKPGLIKVRVMVRYERF
jgi:hypothetical protein